MSQIEKTLTKWQLIIGLVISIVSVGGSYAVTSYRVGEAERKIEKLQLTDEKMMEGSSQLKIDLARLETKIDLLLSERKAK